MYLVNNQLTLKTNIMSNKYILNWWDSMDIVKRISLREKYNYSSGAILDVDDYRLIYKKQKQKK